MNRIEEYVENIYKDFDVTYEEVRFMMEEVKTHLYEEVEELKSQGLSEEESINRAISNFGQDKYVIGEMNNILKRQYKLPKRIVSAIFIIYIVGCLFRFATIPTRFLNENLYYGINNDKNSTQSVTRSIINKLENKESIDENMKNQITSLLDEFNNERNNGLYYVQIEKAGKVYYEYKKSVSVDETKYSNIKSWASQDWMVNYKITDFQGKYDSESQQEFLVKLYNRIPTRLVRGSQYVFILSWALLVFAYIKNSYTRNVNSKQYISFFACASAAIVFMHFTGKVYSPYGTYFFFNSYMFLLIAILMILSKIYNKFYYRRLSSKI